MANYNFYERTNYFRVTDVDKLKELFAETAEVVESPDLPGYVALLGVYESYILSRYDDDADEDIALLPELQELLHPEDAVILQHIGYEKMRYLSGVVIIITKDAVSTLEMESYGTQEAARMLGRDDYPTRHTY